jgi:glycosyltransferase involved in cell wall biosynthesis
MGSHVKMLATGLPARGIAVSVTGPSSADTRFSFSALPSVSFSAVEISGRPRAGDIAGVLRLRRLFLRPAAGGPRGAVGPAAGEPRGAVGPAAGEPPGAVGPAAEGPRGACPGEGGFPARGHVVHAHGLRAGALTVLALTRARTGRPGVVVTVHNAPPGPGAAGLVYRLLERVVARSADLVLCVSPDLERRMRAAGAARVARAVIAAPASPTTRDAPASPTARDAPAALAARDAPAALAAPAASDAPDAPDAPDAAEAPAAPAAPAGPVATGVAAGLPAGRPVVLAVGRLAVQKGFDVLLEAAAAWQDLDPVPLVVIAGEGPLDLELRSRAAGLGVDVLFLGHRDDIPGLLAAAAVFVLPSRWEGQPLALQEALRAGTPVVAARVGGVPVLTGEDAALLVPPGDPRALADAIRSVLTNRPLAARLRAAAGGRAAVLPSTEDAISAALDAYASAQDQAGLR